MPRRSDEVEENILNNVKINIKQKIKQTKKEINRVTRLWESAKNEINKKNKEIAALKDSKNIRKSSKIQELENKISSYEIDIENYVLFNYYYIEKEFTRSTRRK